MHYVYRTKQLAYMIHSYCIVLHSFFMGNATHSASPIAIGGIRPTTNDQFELHRIVLAIESKYCKHLDLEPRKGPLCKFPVADLRGPVRTRT